MKKGIIIYLLLNFIFIHFAQGQDLFSTNLTPNGKLDNVFDRYGKKIPLSNLLIDKKGGGTKSVGPLCSSGYFDLYFEVGSGMEGNSTIEQERRAVICQVFSDISQFIETPNPSIHVNILVKNINPELNGYDPITNPNPAASSGVLGLATGYYVLSSLGPNIIGGIADNEIWKTINSGFDSYTNVASPLSSTSSSNNGSGYYHGMVALNFNNPSINWHLDLSQNTSNGLYDLYSVILHEVTHALGFASLIDVNGDSKFGTNFPYYSRYDLFLNSPSNQPLITNTGNCSMYNYGFNPSLNTNILTPSTFSCTSHVKFGGSVNQPTYTPTTFTNESSLSHLEDLCHDPNNYANDEYYVMSNANGTGPFYMKRYLKPEERDVLCDIGYKVNPNFGNPANLNFYDYGTSVCPGIQIVGINDGIDPNGIVQYFTTVNNNANPLVINDFLLNDFNSTSFECLTDIYGNGIPTVISSSSFSYVATSPGIAVLRYVPISPTGIRGNITYIYIYISANNCNPNNCNFINNGDFELSTNCGQMDYQSPINTSCWSPLSNTPDIFLRNCTNTVNNTNANLSIPASQGSFPPSESWNGIPNNSFVGIVSTLAHYNESFQTALNAPLVHGHTYEISFYARCGNNFMPFGSSGQIIIGGMTNFCAPYGGPETSLPNNIIQLGTTASVINDLNWHLITQTFQYNGQSNLNHLVIYNASNLNTNGQYMVYLYIDQIELTEIQTSLNLNLPSVICLNQSINDLSLYAPIPGGTFSGPGVTNNGNIYSFNPQTAGVGTHTISYSYTNNLNCLITISQQIEVVNSTFTTSINASSTQICSGQTVTLTASSSNPATYTWNPGNLTGVTINPNINTSTLFTLTATNSIGCIASASVNIIVLPSLLNVTPSSSTICSGLSVSLTASGANTYAWTPNAGLSSATGGVVTASPTTSTTYTVSGSTSNGCIESVSIPITVNPLPTIQISPLNPTICSGDFVTMTASGADTYNWDPFNGLSSTTGATVIGTPSSNIVYTVTGTSLNGCINSATTQIIVNPAPIFDITPPFSLICQGEQVTLTANGSFNFDWSPSAGLSNTTGNTVVANPTSTTTYSVTATNPEGCTLTLPVTVNVNPTPIVTVSPYNPVLCLGQQANLTASGATTYTWTPAQGLSSTSGSSVIANPSTTTTYIVNGQNAQGCSAHESVTVTVNPNPSVSVSSSYNYICSGQQVTLSASGALNYTWSPSTGLSSTSGSSVIASPNVTTTYNVNGVDANGCSSTSSINLVVNPCNDCYSGTMLSGTITSSPTTGATLRIANDITISGNISFNANNVKIMPNVTINVPSNSTLTINGSHFYGCESMWKGIVVQPGGKVILQPYTLPNGSVSTTLIEDAMIGIDYLPITTQQNTLVLSSNNTTFNKNGTSIRIQSYLFSNASSVFEVKNSLFTSRTLYNTTTSTWPLTSTVKTANTTVNPLVSPYILSSYALANLKYPMSTGRAQKGMDIKNTGNTVMSSPVVYNSLTIGSLISSEYNVFDNIKVDIYSTNSNLKIQNTIMQITENMSINVFNSTPVGEPAMGTGIFSKSENTFVNKLEVAGSTSLPNQFYGLSTAVMTDNLKEVICNYNTIRSNRSNMPNYAVLSNGERGVFIREINKFDNIQVNNNTFYSINKGMTLIADVAGISPTINVVSNIFKKSSDQLAGGGISNYSVLIENANSTNQMSGGNIWVNSNTIYNSINGIKLNSWKRINQQINNNYISFGKNVTIVSGIVQPEDMIGIRLVNCVLGSINTQIYTNTLIGAVAYNTQNQNYRAIAIESSIGNDVKCNDVSNSYSGLYFSSNCNPTKTSKNNMTNHKYGFVLDNNGIIGQQGTPTSPADNVWLGSTWDATGTANGRFKIASLNFSYAYNSPMYVRNNNISYSPFGSVYNSLNSTQYSVSQLPQSLFIIFNTTPPTACAISSAPPINALMTSDVIIALETTVAYIADTNTLTSDSILLTDQVYRALDSDTSIMQYSTMLTEFYDSTSIKDIGTLLNVEVALANDSIQLATTLNNVVIPDNQVEESYRLYYESYINYQNGTFSSVDSLNVRTLAEGCPVIQGSAVYMAEALYNVVYFEAELFTSICPDYIDKNAPILTNQSTLPTFTIYPVPNDGDFTLTGQIIKGQTIKIKTMDGKVVYTIRVEENTELQTIHTDLVSGVYFVLIEDESNHLLSRNKFIVTK
ncbi:MAG: hypothetical protein ACKOXP_04865 [Flavobacteriales bacterium]